MDGPIANATEELVSRMPSPDAAIPTDSTIHTTSTVRTKRTRRTKKDTSGQGIVIPDALDSGPDSTRAMSVAVSQSLVTVCVMIGGEDWRCTETEFKALNESWEQYFLARGIESVPPELLLGVALTAYAAPRLRNTSMREKVRSMFNRFGRKRDNAARTDSGSNGVG